MLRLTKAHHWLAFGFGSGLSPLAPGTAGSIVGLLLYLPLSHLGVYAYVSVVLSMAIIGIWICGETARDLGVHDHGGIVWDEIVGMLIALTAVPPGWLWLVAGFAIFRLFDVAKPWPISILDRGVGGGLGIMLDDVLAGLFALAVIQGVHIGFKIL